MNINYLKELGSYAPSFFRMNVDTPQSLTNLTQVDEFNLSVFFHEYLHFIQDISTTYGLMNACHVVEYMRFALSEAQNSPQKTFTPPVLPEDNNVYNIDVMIKLWRLYAGNNDNLLSLKVENITYVKKIHADIQVSYKQDYVEKVEVGLDFGFELYFGAIAIMESMAYIGEKILFPNASPSPDFPYKAAHLIVEKIYPEFGGNVLNIFALCDASLMIFNPGLFFYDSLLKMKSDGWLPNDPEEVYDYCHSITFDYEGTTQVQELFALMKEKALSYIADYFKDDHFTPNVVWVLHILEAAHSIRKTRMAFLITLLKKGEYKQNTLLAPLFRYFGTPMVTNSNGEGSFNPSQFYEFSDQPRMDYFWAIQQIYLVFRDKNHRSCELVNFCREIVYEGEIRDITDQRCINCPWERAADEERCAFGEMWRHLGLVGVTPKFSS